MTNPNPSTRIPTGCLTKLMRPVKAVDVLTQIGSNGLDTMANFDRCAREVRVGVLLAEQRVLLGRLRLSLVLGELEARDHPAMHLVGPIGDAQTSRHAEQHRQ